MAYPIDNIVKVNVNIQASGLSTADFSKFCLFDGSNQIEGMTQYYNLPEVTEAFSELPKGDSVIAVATAYFAELPKPNSMAVYGFEAVDDGSVDDGEALANALTVATADESFFYFWDKTNCNIPTTEASYIDLVLSTADALEKFIIWGTNDARAEDAGSTGDIASAMTRVATRHGAAAFSEVDTLIGVRAMAKFVGTFTGTNTTKTLEYKKIAQEGDDLSGSRISVLKAKGYMLNSVVSSAASRVAGALINTRSFSPYGEWIDAVVYTDALVDGLQVSVANVLLTTPTAVRYIPAGYQALISAADNYLLSQIANGFLGERTIVSPLTGEDVLSTGYEIWSKAIDILEASDNDRLERAAPPIDVSIYPAGAIHSGNISLNVN